MSSAAPLPRSTPAAQGMAPGAISAYVTAVAERGLELHSLMLLRHGQVVAEGWWAPYGPTRPHMLFSLSKSFASTAIGLAVAEGRLSVDDAVISFFPADLPPTVSPHLAAMRVRDLLTMTSGHATDTLGRFNGPHGAHWVRAFLALPVEHAPGSFFTYNSGATFMLSAIIQQLTGETLLAYLQPRLLAPLGIQHATWEQTPGGWSVGGWGLSVTTEDIARLGQLYLQQGRWQGRQVLPADWCAAATAFRVPNASVPTDSDWTQGYGYQFWRCRHGAYRGDGAFGQYCVVLPGQDAVLAITSAVGDMQAVLTLAWTHLLPACGPAPLPPDDAAQAALTQQLAALALPPFSAAPSAPLAAAVSGKVYGVAENTLGVRALCFTFSAAGAELQLTTASGAEVIPVGHGSWREGSTSLLPQSPQPVVASGGWTAPGTYIISLRAIHTPFTYTLSAQFNGADVTLTTALNFAFHSFVPWPVLSGHAGTCGQ